MCIHRKSSAALISIAALLAATGPGRATTSTTNMTVSITITAACNISVTNINYGTMQGTALLSAQTSTAAMGGLFSYTCSPGSTTPALTYGPGSNNSSGTNRMKGTTNGGFIPYSLTMPTIATFTGAAQTAQITATIPSQSSAPSVDSYSDTVVLTLTY